MRTLRCPICKKPVAPNDPEMPFCSARCRLIDLGNWASEKYVIPSALQDSEDEEADLPGGSKTGDEE
jgi:endogenous inhibitor of DNA gyrase (YacG/DUF329 family)